MNSPILSSASVSERPKQPQTDTALEVQCGLQRKSSISRLKEFYLRRLSQSETAAVSRLRAKSATFSSPRWSPRTSGIETEWDAASSKGFSKASETGSSDVQTSPSSRLQECTKAVPRKSMTDLDAKLEAVMAGLESRILECLEPNAMRHLKQLRRHLETALRWTTSPEISVIGEQTAQQVKQLNGTARVLAPGIYVFSKRAEHLIVKKERILKKMASNLTSDAASVHRNRLADSLPDLRVPASQYRAASTIVSELDSECGTGTATMYAEYADTVTWDAWDGPDVGNIQEVNDYLALKTEDEQRRWFYSQCLAAKMNAADQAKARKILVSDLYMKVKSAALPVGSWTMFIRGELAPATA